MLGLFLMVMGIVLSLLGLSIESFENPKHAKPVRRGFFLVGLSLFTVGITLAFFTL